MRLQKFPLLFSLFLLPFTQLSAAETEPNNTKATANTLALNGSNTGAIGVSGDEDWWKVTTNTDGKLTITITISNGLTMRCELYDNNGSILLNSSYTSSTTTFSYDGMATGTYFLKVYAYYNGQLPAYTLANTLTVPAQANDAEPNNLFTQAKDLPLNNAKTGHIGYYYNNVRDTSDWYKVTTNADGRLRLTVTSHNGETVYAYLYDIDGTTLLGSGYTSSTSAVVNEDGLAAGSYYVKIKAYYSNKWSPYTLADSLFKPAQANDVEPNDNRAQAIALPLNGSKTGHSGYYFNNKRDSADWYKLTTNADGMVKIDIQSNNGETVYAYLYDNDGTRLFESAYTSASTSFTVDGLQPGTYFIKIRPYYSTKWVPYTLSNTLNTYANTNDAEPNGSFIQAKTIPANGDVQGHVNFYYNGQRDAEDRWKINYTGSGNLTLVFSQENRLKYGSPATTYFRVYKDTNASPIAGSYYSTNSTSLNLTNLTTGYYYIKVNTYYSTELTNLCAYRIEADFIQVAKAKIKVTSATAVPACASSNSIIFKCSAGNPPFTVQLYRYGIAYGSPVLTNNNASFNNLPAGAYYATVYADGATGSASGKSTTVNLLPAPTGTNTSNITANKARANWSVVSCAKFYTLQYRVKGTATWTTKRTTGNTGFYNITGLTPATQYEWKVAAADSANNITANSVFTDSLSFTTGGSFALNAAGTTGEAATSKVTETIKLVVTPNPAISYVTIRGNVFSTGNITLTFTDINGKIYTRNTLAAGKVNGHQLNVSTVANGIYVLRLTDETGRVLVAEKIIVQH